MARRTGAVEGIGLGLVRTAEGREPGLVVPVIQRPRRWTSPFHAAYEAAVEKARTTA
jgi:hypothetical protein